ncbi:hypothetical protein BOTBODRAFT_30425, partial [Botryobasidium botryosum FD-172 SS1]
MQAGWTTRRQSCRQVLMPREQDVKGTIDGGRVAGPSEAKLRPISKRSRSLRSSTSASNDIPRVR